MILEESLLISSELPLQQEDVYAYTKNSATGLLLSWFSRVLIWISKEEDQADDGSCSSLSMTPNSGPEGTNRSTKSGSSTYQGVAVAGFAAMLWVSAATSLLGPMRDAAALAVGVQALPNLTLASTLLALASSVPVGWLFEAPDPTLTRRLVLRRMGFTRGDTHGTSLALFYRTFATLLIVYALVFLLFTHPSCTSHLLSSSTATTLHRAANVAFFLIVHLMKLHSISLMWGVVGQALDFEEQAIQLHMRKQRALDTIHRLKMQQQQQHPQEQLLGHRIDSTTSIASSSNSSTASNPTSQQDTRQPLVSRLTHHQQGVNLTAATNKSNNYTSYTNNSANNTTTNRARISRLAFVGFGSTLGGIIGSFIASSTAHLLRIYGLLLLSALILIFSANLSIELGTLMRRHWEEGQIVRNWELFIQNSAQLENFTSNTTNDSHVSQLNMATTNYKTGCTTKSMIRASQSMGCMKPLAAAAAASTATTITASTTTTKTNLTNINTANPDFTNLSLQALQKSSTIGTMKRVASGNSLAATQYQQQKIDDYNRNDNINNHHNHNHNTTIKRSKSLSSVSVLQNINKSNSERQHRQLPNSIAEVNENSFSQRLLRGVTTIVRSRLLMAIFTYNALYASTTVLLSFQRAELVANRKITTSTSTRSSSSSHAEADTAFLAKINTVSNVAVFALQACGLGAFLANTCGQRGTLLLMPLCRLFGVLLLLGWHVKGHGKPPDLTLFLLLDELTRVINFAVAKPVREGLWRGLSNEARYEAKPIVDTLANRWGSGSAAFLVSLMDRMLSFVTWLFVSSTSSSNEALIIQDSDRHVVKETLTIKSVFGFPPLLLLCLVISAWWVMVSLHLGHTRSRIDVELKKHQ